MKISIRLSFLLCFALLVGCEETESNPIAATAEGGDCAQTSDCVAGFECTEKICTAVEPIPDRPYRGTACTANQHCACPSGMECGDSLFCGPQNLCTISEGLNAGEICGLSVNCKKIEPDTYLYCNGFTSLCTHPDDVTPEGDPLPGSFSDGDDCEEMLDCRRPLICGLDKTCTKLPFFEGANCSRSDQELGAFRVYFELPEDDIFGESAQLPENFEFYRLPFPSNIRVNNGRTSLTGHSNPGEILGVNVKQDFFDVIEDDVQGFGITSPVFFRFSDIVDPETICLDSGSSYPDLYKEIPFEFSQLEQETAEPEAIVFCKDQGEPNIFLVNLDAQESERSALPLQVQLSQEHSQYICGNWVGVAPLDGNYLEHGTTYAAIVLNSVHSQWKDVPIQDMDFEDILSGKVEQAAMDPLLDWLDAHGISKETVAGAAVFTTTDPDTIAPKLRAAVHNEPAPTFNSDSHSCDDAPEAGPCTLFPCRPTSAASFYEVRGTYPNPIFQNGERPYKTPEDGGDITRDANGNPTSTGNNETMCYSAAVPKGVAMPTDGWPIVIYAHGTGGNFASLTQSDAQMAQLFGEAGYASISFDNVMHGRRQSNDGSVTLETMLDAGQSFFNLANPRASRDNILQGSADLFHLVRLIKNDPNGIAVPGNGNLQNVKINSDKIIFLGHSQGTVIAAAFIAAETDIDGIILSGAGADLMLSILNKKSPMDMSTVAGFFFGDTNLTRIHPVMGAMSTLFGESDMLSYSPTYVRNPIAGRVPVPLLLFSGIYDSFTPTATHNALMRSAGLPIIGELQSDVPGVIHNPNSEVSLNLNGTTAGALQFTPTGEPGETLNYDGHFIIYYDPVAQASISTFLETALTGTVKIKR